MERTDFMKWFEANVKSRWPKIEFSATDVADWYHKFGGCEEMAALSLAVRTHKVEDDPYSPHIKRIAELLRRFSPPRTTAKTKTVEPENVFNWDKWRTTAEKEKRVKMIRLIWKISEKLANKYDPQALEWAKQCVPYDDEK